MSLPGGESRCGSTMTRKRNKLADLWQLYLNQESRPSDATHAYVAALKARIDLLEIEIAIVKTELRKARGEEPSP